MSKAADASRITIRHCTTVPEFDECVAIEHATWGKEISVPNGMFIVAHHTGGQAFAAFDGAKMIGFTLAVAGIRKFGPHSGQTTADGKYTPFMHSHLTAVLDAYRNSGVGRRLKLFQRQDALDRGVPLVEWTFDPLELKNAYFNIAKLGVIVRRYIPNCYGVTESPLHGGMPTDRFVPEWWLDSERVKAIVEGKALAAGTAAQRISLPRNFADIRALDMGAALRIQADLRARCERAFAEGLVIVGVEIQESSVDYLLQYAGEIPGLGLPALVKS